MSETRLTLDGLSCAGCVRRAEAAIEGAGAQDVRVNLANGEARYSGAGLADVTAALAQAGYPARVSSLEFNIEGMSCASCVARVEQAARGLAGVEGADVNFATERLTVRGVEGVVSARDVAGAVAQAGYEATPATQAASLAERRVEEAGDLKRELLFAAALALPVFLMEMGGHVFPPVHHFIHGLIGQSGAWLVQLVLTTLVLVGPGRRFYLKGLPALRRGAPDMNSLVAVGTLAAYLYSVVALFMPALLPEASRAVYFEAAAVIVVLILLGRWLEARAKGQAGAAIERLLQLAPDTVDVKRGEGFVTLALSEVQTGDVLRLAAGARVPVDGHVVSGQSHVDEAMLTGEPMPVFKAEGDALAAGTVNGAGLLEMRAEAVGDDTALAGIVRAVEDAQAVKLPVQAVVDRVTQWFVPVVMGLSLVTLCAWLTFGGTLAQALVAAVSVLIIACPCAMGLATPMSIMVGTGRGAEKGMFFRRGDALQRLAEVKVMAFDKTGTLTEGKPELVTFEAVGFEREDLLRRVAAAEQGSDHPVARAIVAACEGPLPEAQDVEAVAGMGLRATVGGQRIVVGTARLMADEGISLPAEEGAQGSVSYVAVNGAYAGCFIVEDTLKAGAQEAINAVAAQGVTPAMITGDAAGPAQQVAQALGIARVSAEVLPAGKQRAVEELKEIGPVAFVGDGINDAPALAAADVGIAMGSGTDVAIESAELVLMGDDPRKAVEARGLAQRVMQNIRQNLFWAFAYNAALIPLAAGVFYPWTGWMLSPVLAAGAMALSSVFVVSNALRLRRA